MKKNNSAIVVLHYNKIKLTQTCVQSVLDAGYPPDLIYCFDNGSKKDVYEEVKELFPQCHHNRIDENGGFSRGFNRSLEWVFEAGYSSALFLTNDTKMYPGALEACLETAAGTGAGMVAPCVIYLSSEGKEEEDIDSTGGWFDAEKCMLNHYHDRGLPILLDREKDYIPGTAVWINKETFQALSGTDESYHMYWEDVELCFRAHLAGIRLARCYDAKVAHGVGQTCRKKPLYTTFYFHRNRVRFCKKYLKGEQLRRAKELLESEFLAMQSGWRERGDNKRLNYFERLMQELT